MVRTCQFIKQLKPVDWRKLQRSYLCGTHRPPSSPHTVRYTENTGCVGSTGNSIETACQTLRAALASDLCVASDLRRTEHDYMGRTGKLCSGCAVCTTCAYGPRLSINPSTSFSTFVLRALFEFLSFAFRPYSANALWQCQDSLMRVKPKGEVASAPVRLQSAGGGGPVAECEGQPRSVRLKSEATLGDRIHLIACRGLR